MASKSAISDSRATFRISSDAYIHLSMAALDRRTRTLAKLSVESGGVARNIREALSLGLSIVL